MTSSTAKKNGFRGGARYYVNIITPERALLHWKSAGSSVMCHQATHT